MKDTELIHLIRTICAREFNSDYSFDFFNLDYRPGETPDEALLRMFHAEREHNDGDEEAVLVLCHG